MRQLSLVTNTIKLRKYKHNIFELACHVLIFIIIKFTIIFALSCYTYQIFKECNCCICVKDLLCCKFCINSKCKLAKSNHYILLF